MQPRMLSRLDACTTILLGLWALAALGLLVSGRFEPFSARWLDHAAWLAFGGALALSGGSRWLEEIQDEAPIGPLRLWSFAALAALLICMSSALLVGPRWRELAALDTHRLTPEFQSALARARSLSKQFLVLRAILAVTLALTVRHLPIIPIESK